MFAKGVTKLAAQYQQLKFDKNRTGSRSAKCARLVGSSIPNPSSRLDTHPRDCCCWFEIPCPSLEILIGRYNPHFLCSFLVGRITPTPKCCILHETVLFAIFVCRSKLLLFYASVLLLCSIYILRVCTKIHVSYSDHPI